MEKQGNSLLINKIDRLLGNDTSHLMTSQQENLLKYAKQQLQEGKPLKAKKQIKFNHLMDQFNQELNGASGEKIALMNHQMMTILFVLVLLSFTVWLLLSNNQQNTREQVQSTLLSNGALKLNQLHFVFDKQFSSEELERIVKVLQISYPEISEYLPAVKELSKTIHVKKISHGLSSASFEDGEMKIRPTSTDGLIIHEFVHLLKGEKDLFVDFAEEGLANAISIKIANKLNLKALSGVKEVTLSPNLQNGGLAVDNRILYRRYRPLRWLRYHFASQFWLKSEKEHPGFIKKFHESYYRYLDEGGKKEDLFGSKLFEILKNIDSELVERLTSSNPVLNFSSENGIKRCLSACFVKYIDGERRLEIFLYQRRGKDGLEQGFPGAPLTYQFINLRTGKTSRPRVCFVNSQGKKTLRIDKSFLKLGCGGLEDNYKVRLMIRLPSGCVTEEFNVQF